MLLKHVTLEGIRDGRITLAFRRWKRPTVKAGGTLFVQEDFDPAEVVRQR